MKLLLDTHIAVWSVMDDPKLSDLARDHVGDPLNECFVSVVTIWEVAIKFAFGQRRRDPMPFSGTEAQRWFEQAGFAILPVTAAHAAAIDDLPPIHADPFDRMLVAQARSAPMYLLTGDTRLEGYGAFVTVV